MGVKSLTQLLKRFAPSSIQSLRGLSEFADKAIAIDTQLFATRFIKADDDRHGLQMGRTPHQKTLYRMYLFATMLKNAGIIPVFVFDNPVKTELKSRELLNRAVKSAKVVEELEIERLRKEEVVKLMNEVDALTGGGGHMVIYKEIRSVLGTHEGESDIRSVPEKLKLGTVDPSFRVEDKGTGSKRLGFQYEAFDRVERAPSVSGGGFYGEKEFMLQAQPAPDSLQSTPIPSASLKDPTPLPAMESGTHVVLDSEKPVQTPTHTWEEPSPFFAMQLGIQSALDMQQSGHKVAHSLEESTPHPAMQSETQPVLGLQQSVRTEVESLEEGSPIFPMQSETQSALDMQQMQSETQSALDMQQSGQLAARFSADSTPLSPTQSETRPVLDTRQSVQTPAERLEEATPPFAVQYETAPDLQQSGQTPAQFLEELTPPHAMQSETQPVLDLPQMQQIPTTLPEESIPPSVMQSGAQLHVEVHHSRQESESSCEAATPPLLLEKVEERIEAIKDPSATGSPKSTSSPQDHLSPIEAIKDPSATGSPKSTSSPQDHLSPSIPASRIATPISLGGSFTPLDLAIGDLSYDHDEITTTSDDRLLVAKERLDELRRSHDEIHQRAIASGVPSSRLQMYEETNEVLDRLISAYEKHNILPDETQATTTQPPSYLNISSNSLSVPLRDKENGNGTDVIATKISDLMTRTEKNLRNLQLRELRITPDLISDIQIMLKLLGFPTIQSPHEGEAMCAYLTTLGITAATATEDLDACVFGDGLVIRNLSYGVNRLQELKLINPKVAREEIGFDEDLWIDFMILCGTDFAPTIRQVRGVRAISLLRKHGSIEGVLKWKGMESHEDLEQFVAAREFFKAVRGRGGGNLGKPGGGKENGEPEPWTVIPEDFFVGVKPEDPSLEEFLESCGLGDLYLGGKSGLEQAEDVQEGHDFEKAHPLVICGSTTVVSESRVVF
ncbi:Elongation of fatty acids protein 2 [Blyttiomyces sp. JEL0837]|nr:Elongation of fatty acids protein 2 [Blyttiomyces sp. JEL0837]